MGRESCNSVLTESRNKVLTYVVLVILIALWAMVLLPPYLKDRRASGRTFRSMQSSSMSSAQRFLPLQQASGTYSTAAVTKGTGMRTTGVTPLGSSSNVVHLRPLVADSGQAPIATSAAAYATTAAADEAALLQAWEQPDSAGLGLPTSTSAARERRRQVVLGLTGLALITLLLAMFVGGRWIAAHVFVDVVMVGYVILLVRHRQLVADRRSKVEPIRPPVTDHAPASMQLAPAYLLRSKTGS